MGEVEIGASRRSYEVVFEAEDLWILPEVWKTPGRAEMHRIHGAGVSHTSLDGASAAHKAPQARQQPLSQGESDVRFAVLDTLRKRRPPKTIVASLRRVITIIGIRVHDPRNRRSHSAEYAMIGLLTKN